MPGSLRRPNAKLRGEGARSAKARRGPGKPRLPDGEQRVQAGRIHQDTATYLKALGFKNIGRAIDAVVARVRG